MKATITKNNEDSFTVEMPNTQGAPEVYSVFFPGGSGSDDAWVHVQRTNGKWALLNSRTHHQQIRRVVSAINSAA
jgi:hypothetical protein